MRSWGSEPKLKARRRGGEGGAAGRGEKMLDPKAVKEMRGPGRLLEVLG